MFWLMMAVVMGVGLGEAHADHPCDRYPVGAKPRCEQYWKQINQEAEAEMAAFGLRQLERRQNGTLTPEQHLSENMAFIKASAEKRLKLLHKRMEQP